MSFGGPENNPSRTAEITDAIKGEQTLLDQLNAHIKDGTLDNQDKKQKDVLKAALLNNPDKATETLYTTLNAINSKAGDKGDKKALKPLEQIKELILDGCSTMEKVGAYQLKTEIINEKFNFVSLQKFGSLFSKQDSPRFKNIGPTYTKGAYPDFDAMFAKGGVYENAYFTPEQLQTGLYEKNQTRIVQIKTQLQNIFSDETILTVLKDKGITKTSQLKLGSSNIWQSIKDIDGATEFEDMLAGPNNPIYNTWTKQIFEAQEKKNADADLAKQLEQSEADTLVADFSEANILTTYLKGKSPDAIYKFNQGTESKLTDIVSSLTKWIKAAPGNNTLKALITQLKTGDIKGFQKIIYSGTSSQYKNRNDGKLGKESFERLKSYVRYGEMITITSINDLPVKSAPYTWIEKKVYKMDAADRGYYMFYGDGTTKIVHPNGTATGLAEKKSTADVVNSLKS